MTLLVTIFFAQFIFIGLKAFQQRVVVAGQYMLMGVGSMGMASVEVYIVSTIAREGPSVPLVLTLGTSAWAGCALATYSHHRLTRFIDAHRDPRQPARHQGQPEER